VPSLMHRRRVLGYRITCTAPARPNARKSHSFLTRRWRAGGRGIRTLGPPVIGSRREARLTVSPITVKDGASVEPIVSAAVQLDLFFASGQVRN
jgi:hypothetical protein